MAEKLITLAVKEKDNFETVKVSAKVLRRMLKARELRKLLMARRLLYMRQ